jgi:hypothetical protein
MANNWLEKLQTTQIPNSYYLLVVLAFASVAGVVYLAAYTPQDNVTQNGAQAPQKQLRTFDTNRLTYGMTRRDVIHALGKPDWAAFPTDSGSLAPPKAGIGLELRWDNPACRDVVVMFDESRNQVIGWDDGAKFCRQNREDDRDTFACSLPERAEYCR